MFKSRSTMEGLDKNTFNIITTVDTHWVRKEI